MVYTPQTPEQLEASTRAAASVEPMDRRSGFQLGYYVGAYRTLYAAYEAMKAELSENHAFIEALTIGTTQRLVEPTTHVAVEGKHAHLAEARR